MKPVPDRRIEDMGVSPRVLRLLRRAACRTVADVVAKWPYEIARVSGVGAVVMQEIHERLSQLISNIQPIPNLWKPRRGATVSVSYSPDKQTFLGHAAVAWDARAEKERREALFVHRTRRRTSERRSILEAEQVQLLRYLMEGLTAEQVAALWHCSTSAIYARKQRLIRLYAPPTRLAQLPTDLQRFLLRESKKEPHRTPVQEARRGRSSPVSRANA
jgi:hypothetical protein